MALLDTEDDCVCYGQESILSVYIDGILTCSFIICSFLPPFCSYEKYYLMCALTHNGRNLFKPIQSKKVGTYKSFFYHIKWDEMYVTPYPLAIEIQ